MALAAVIFDETFDTGSLSGWTTSTPAGTTVTVQSDPSPTNRSLRLSDTSFDVSAAATKSFSAAATTTLTAEWRYKEDVAGNWTVMSLKDGGTVAIGIVIDPSKKIGWVDGAGVTQYTDVTTTNDSWYTVKVEANLATDRFNLYVNNIPRVRGAYFRNPVGRVDGFEIKTGGSYASTVHVDYVRASSGDAINVKSYQHVVQEFADVMIDNPAARDDLGAHRGGLLQSMLDRTTYTPPGSKPPLARIREQDRGAPSWSNFAQDTNLFRVFNTLTDISGQAKYRDATNAAVRQQLARAQNPVTKLMGWGEHLYYNTSADAVTTNDDVFHHEFTRPIILWDRMVAENPTAAFAYARGVWDNQIHDKTSGNFSRHANWDRRQTGVDYDFTAHAAYMIDLWSRAYASSTDPSFRTTMTTAIATLVSRFEDKQNNYASGLIQAAVVYSGVSWLGQNNTMARYLHDGAQRLPDGSLRTRMLALAGRIDASFLAADHDFTVSSRGLLGNANVVNGTPYAEGDSTGYPGKWGAGYGVSTQAALSLKVYARYQQLSAGATRTSFGTLILNTADVYLASEPTSVADVWPIDYAAAISLQMNAFRISGARKYFDRARRLATDAVNVFWSGSSRLPRASSLAGHYEAITAADSLALALLDVHVAEKGLGVTVPGNNIDK